MKQLLALIILILSLDSFSSEVINFNCTRLIDANLNGVAYNIPKAVDLEVNIYPDEGAADMIGTMIADTGSSYYDLNDDINIYSYFSDRREYKQDGDNVSISSSERNFICGQAWAPCRAWDKMNINLTTGLTTIEMSHSYNKISGGVVFATSIKIICSQK